jgi:hypothetical protein
MSQAQIDQMKQNAQVSGTQKKQVRSFFAGFSALLTGLC